jgi:aminobenzoyl-glutamate utilization protein B
VGAPATYPKGSSEHALRQLESGAQFADLEGGNEPATAGVPTIGVLSATFVPGVAAHSWQATASAGMSIGQRGMVVAAKALALTGADLLADPSLVRRAHEHEEPERRLAAHPYRSLIPADQKPPLELAL